MSLPSTVQLLEVAERAFQRGKRRIAGSHLERNPAAVIRFCQRGGNRPVRRLWLAKAAKVRLAHMEVVENIPVTADRVRAVFPRQIHACRIQMKAESGRGDRAYQTLGNVAVRREVASVIRRV